MSRRKEVCICGFECRSDYMRKHTEICKARHTIVTLRDENLVLKSKVIFFTELQQNSHGDEITYLRNQLDLKNKIIQQKDEEIRRLSSNQNITNHFNVTNVLNIFPFGQEPMIDKHIANSLLLKPSESVPLYIKMKHTKDGVSNVRIKDDDIEVIEEDANGQLTWVMKDKYNTIFQITDTNLEEFHEEFGSTDFMWKRWFINNGYNQDGYENTEKFQDLMKKVEKVFIED